MVSGGTSYVCTSCGEWMDGWIYGSDGRQGRQLCHVGTGATSWLSQVPPPASRGTGVTHAVEYLKSIDLNMAITVL